MMTVPQGDVALSDVALLLQQQRYDKALPILNDLVEKNPADLKTRIYRLLVVRIIVLQDSFIRPTIRSTKYLRAIARVITGAASAVRAFELHKMGAFFVRRRRAWETSPDDRHSQSQSELAELTQLLDLLMTKNKEQAEEINSLSSKLAVGERTVKELDTMQNQLSGAQFETQQLQTTNQDLQRGIANIKEQLQASETRLSESVECNREAAHRYARLQSEVSGLKQQVEESRAKVRELEAVRQQMANFESREMLFKDRQHELEAQIAGLKRELSEGKEKIQELDAAREQVAEIENLCQELREENRLLEEEISRRQALAAESEEYQRQVGALRHHLDELQGKQAAVQNTSNAGAELTPELIDFAVPHQSSDESTAMILVLKEKEIKPAVWRRWRFAMIPAAGAITIAVAVVVAVLGTRLGTFFPSKEPRPASVTALEETEFSKHRLGLRPAPRLRGTFKTTRPTQLYREPSEYSALVARIGPGMKINVIDSRDGWLEIRSKHGRPPGFLRQEAAVRIAQN